MFIKKILCFLYSIIPVSTPILFFLTMQLSNRLTHVSVHMRRLTESIPAVLNIKLLLVQRCQYYKVNTKEIKTITFRKIIVVTEHYKIHIWLHIQSRKIIKKNNKHDQSTFERSAPLTSAGSCTAETGHSELQGGNFPQTHNEGNI